LKPVINRELFSLLSELSLAIEGPVLSHVVLLGRRFYSQTYGVREIICPGSNLLEIS
jgi:hypothetical protein